MCLTGALLLDNAASLNNAAIRILSFENTIIDQNLISFTDPHVIHFIASQSINAFQNLAPDGAVLPYYEEEDGGGGGGPFFRQDGLEDKVADAFLVGLL